MSIPEWNISGVIPPIRPGEQGASPDRSPYKVTLVDVIKRFATSKPRIDILDGFLKYRAALHELSLISGFQWLDGSFTEEVEVQESRPPRDIDIVTFYTLPNGFDQKELIDQNVDLFTKPPIVKKKLSCGCILHASW